MQAGDPQRASLYRQALGIADGLYQLARRLTGEGDAEDLVQETYARALAGLDGFEPGSNLRAWMFRILRNAFIDQARRRRADPTQREVELTDEVGAPDDAASEQLRAATARDVEVALAALPADSRLVILLDLEGLTQLEVASVLDVPVGTVKSRLSRARAALRARLQDER